MSLALNNATDSAEIAAIQQRLDAASRRLEAMVADVGSARQVREFESDRRKSALAKAMTPFLEESAAKAEAKARASYNYTEEMKALAEQLRAAETTVAAWEAARAEFDAARSLLALCRDLGNMR